MSRKKTLFALFITLTLLTVVAGSALAAPAAVDSNELHPRGGRLRGEITAVGDDEFTLETRAGNEITLQVDDETRYLGDLVSFADLEVGLVVGVAVVRNGGDAPLAKAITSGSVLGATRAHGEVTAVGSDSLTIETRAGESLTFEVSADTEFHSRDGSVTSLADISEGDLAIVAYKEDGSSLVALVIGVGQPQGRGPQGGPGGGTQGGSGGGYGPGFGQNG